MIVGSVFSRRRMNGLTSVPQRAPRLRGHRIARSARRTASERFQRAEEPGLRNSMIDHSSDRRFSTGVPVSATRWPAQGLDGPGLLGAGVLDVLRLVEHDHLPPDAFNSISSPEASA